MKKLLVKLFSIAAILILGAGFNQPTASAESVDLFFGQDHSYSVIFRGNGEAIVYAKLAFTNGGEEDQTDYSFSLPKVTPSEIAIYQMVLPEECVEYDYTDSTLGTYSDDRICKRYQEADYNQSYYYSYSNSDAEYEKAEYTNDGQNFKITLPSSVKPKRSGALIIAYAAKGYVTENMGLFKFNFETIAVPSRINSLVVAVDVDSDLVLRGNKAKVNYSNSTMKATAEGAADASFTSEKLDDIVGNIGSYTSLTKEASNLSKNETFSVKGQYATSWARLYTSSIILSILIPCGIVVLSILLFKIIRKNKIAKKLENQEVGSSDTGTAENQSVAPTTVAVNSKNEPVNFGKIVVLGLLSDIMIAAAIGIPLVIMYMADNVLNMSYNPIMSVMMFLIIILLTGLAILCLPIIYSIKHGWKNLIFIIVSEICWGIILLILYTVLYQTGLTNFYQYRNIVY